MRIILSLACCGAATLFTASGPSVAGAQDAASITQGLQSGDWSACTAAKAPAPSQACRVIRTHFSPAR